MRILQCYRFFTGTKIPFDKLPGIIEEYLRKQNLSHCCFHYCMTSFADGEKRTACERAAAENPFLGNIQIEQERYYEMQSLNNFSLASNTAKDSIYKILPKIYRRYGFVETCLIYRDIDFFSRRVATPMPQTEYLMNGYMGCGITIYRSCLSQDNAVILAVDSPYPGEIPDATPYAHALAELLPGIKYISATRVVMEQDEQAQYDSLHAAAAPLILQAKTFFAEKMPEEKGNNEPDEKVNVAAWLKKLGKQYGYTYSGYRNRIYFMEKKLPDGHYICLEFVSNSLNPDADPYVKLCGLGFNHEIWVDGFSPQNSQDASEYFTKLFDVLSQAEKTVFPAIWGLYPATPDWFLPTH